MEVTCSTSDDTRYYYVMNFKDEDQVLPDSLGGKTDLISGAVIPAGTVLKKWDVLILQEEKYNSTLKFTGECFVVNPESVE